MAFITSSNSLLVGSDYDFYNNIQFGNSNKETFDAFIPNTALSPTGAVFYFHGGGFTGGDKNDIYDDDDEVLLITNCIDNDIAFFSFNYDLMESDVEINGVIASLESAKLGTQFVSYYKTFFNIDITKIVFRGGSAGAGISLWLGHQNTYAIPADPNYILREFVKPVAVMANIPQATYDLQGWEDDVFADLNYDLSLDYDTNEGSRVLLHRFYGISNFAEFEDPSLEPYRLSVNMINIIKTQSPVDTRINSYNTFNGKLVNNTVPDINHSPYHGELLRNKLILEGVEVRSNVLGLSGDNLLGEDEISYIIRKLI